MSCKTVIRLGWACGWGLPRRCAPRGVGYKFHGIRLKAIQSIQLYTQKLGAKTKFVYIRVVLPIYSHEANDVLKFMEELCSREFCY